VVTVPDKQNVNADVIGGRPDDVLASCVSSQRTNALSVRLAQLTESEWLTLAGRAQRHELLPLLHTCVQALPSAPSMPARVGHALATSYARVSLENERRYADLVNVATALQTAGIAVIALKGAYLADAVYTDRGLRAMCDLDLLVRRSDLPAVDDVMQALRYERSHSPLAELVGGHHLPLFARPGATQIEVHWSINVFGLPWEPEPGHPVFNIDMDQLWARAESVSLAGLEMLSLSPDDLVLHLCLHMGCNDGFHNGLRNVCDIDRVVRRRGSAIDWSRLVATARVWRATPIVQVVCRLAHELLASPIPDTALNQMPWTPRDEAIYPVIRAEVLRFARDESEERVGRRAVIDPWIVQATGAPSRGTMPWAGRFSHDIAGTYWA
jgi:Uncharacterised nucleotidyltransferase